MWNYIVNLADELLSRYPTSLEEDNEILDKDQIEQHLSTNERNCIIHRKGEKVVLNFLKECADRLEEFSEMTMKHGTKWVSSWEMEETY